MKKFKRMIIAVRGDTQGGHAGGLLNPETQIPEIDLDEQGNQVISGYRTPELRPVQKRMWEWHEDGRNAIETLAGKDPIVFLELGDLTQGNIFKDDLAEASLNTQVIISRYSMLPWLRMRQVKTVRIAKGTGVHVWGEGATETILTAVLKAEFPNKCIEISDHWLLNFDGYVVDAAHHGPGPGMRNWTRGNVFDLYIKSMMRDLLDRDELPPNLVLRAHRHEFTYGFAKHQIDHTIYKSEGYIIPPMCFIGSHAQKVVNSPDRMGIGMMAFELVDGKLLDTHYFLHTIDLRNRRTE